MAHISELMKAHNKGTRPLPYGPLVAFLFLLALPLAWIVLVPLALFSAAVQYLFVVLIPSAPLVVFQASVAQKDAPSAEEREFDVILYGASGFTGKFAVEHIAKTYLQKGKPADPILRWAVAGRSQSALEKVVKEICGDDRATLLPILIAEANDVEAIRRLVRRTKVVISTAGPFFKYSHEIVRQCAENGTHFADITGEVDWVAVMIDQHGETAKTTGARIVSCCGHDSVPWDLTVCMINQELKKKGESTNKVECYDDIRGAPSGGTLATVASMIDGGFRSRWIHKQRLAFNPWLQTSAGSKSLTKTKISNPFFPIFSHELKKWQAFFVMAEVNGKVAQRSNALLGYNPDGTLVYSEGQVFPDFWTALISVLGLLIVLPVLFIPPLRAQLFLAPGTGPSRSALERGFLRIQGKGTGDKGTIVRTDMYFPRDAGYIDTARMLVECGVLLAQSKKGGGGGFHTPASAFGSSLIDRLKLGGTVFEMK
jgi:short subunit dehydrogenase-like uncharacterized protein